MKYEIKTRKTDDGWVAESEAILGETPEGTRVLELRTSKVRGGRLAAFASVFIYKDRGTSFASKTTMIFSDFTKRNIALTECKRVTEKSVLEVHKYALLEMGSIIEEAKAFYTALQPE